MSEQRRAECAQDDGHARPVQTPQVPRGQGRTRLQRRAHQHHAHVTGSVKHPVDCACIRRRRVRRRRVRRRSISRGRARLLGRSTTIVGSGGGGPKSMRPEEGSTELPWCATLAACVRRGRAPPRRIVGPRALHLRLQQPAARLQG